MSLESVQTKIGIRFRDLALLELALTHSSYVHEKKLTLEASNERLEFLGDAVLGICIAELLIRAFPNEAEGALSKRRAALVNQKQLARLSEQLELGAALRLGKGEDKTGGRKKASLLADVFEALIGALYLDQGLEVVQRFLAELFADLIPVSKKVETSQDYKTKLQEYYQRTHSRSPKYLLLRETGPDHAKTFEVKIDFDGDTLGQGVGKSKREAEQDAARNVFLKLGDLSFEKKPRRRSKKSKRLEVAQVRDTLSGKSKGVS
jgi:ribonuclease-3